MFCTECGQQMGDDAKFCAYCGTRRTVVPAGTEVSATPLPPRPEPTVVTTPPPTRTTIRSTAEIMPIRVQRPSPPPPRVTEAEPVVEPDERRVGETPVPWPTDESASPSLFTQPVVPPPPVRPAAPPPAAYNPAPPVAAEVAQPDRYSSVPFAAPPATAEVRGERRKISPVLIGAIVIALIALAGIVWMLRSSMTGAGKAAENVAITIYPTAVKVVVGKSADFAATITGAPTSEVTWKVEEGDDAGQIQTRGAYSKEGAISLYCTYTAPKTPGTYHLVATSTANASKSAASEITVTAK
jgi:hypothetical protein